MTIPRKTWLAGALAAAGFALLYQQVIVKLVMDWYHDANYSHGFLIVPLALYFASERRGRLATLPLAPSAFGLVVVLGSVCVLMAGILGSELFLTRISIIGTVVGVLLFVCGWQHLRALAFPVAFLLLMLPMPPVIFNQIMVPLQLLASQFGESALRIANVPVLREGNVLILAHTTLQVAEACSGIRSLVSLLTLAIVLGYFSDPRGWVRTLVALSSIPVAIVTNGFRVAGTGIAAHRFGAVVAEGFFHEFSGWLVFVTAFMLMLAVQRAILSLAPSAARASAVAAAV
jgi:exosortase